MRLRAEVKKWPAYYIKGNLSEKQIEADVAAFFGWCTPPGSSLPFRLLDVDEQLTGADKLFDRVVPIYMQFKKSDGLKCVTQIAPSKRKGRSALEDIRIFRAEKELDTDPTLFFQLRAKAPTAVSLQHNVLHAYERPPYSRAIYVAPLLLDKNQYHWTLFSSANRYLRDPFYYRAPYRLRGPTLMHRFAFVPFLREHVSIPPHTTVSDHLHFYAYSESGVDISWHSPDILSREPARLSDFLAKVLRSAIANPQENLMLDVAAKTMIGIAVRHGFPQPVSGNDGALENLLQHGRWLRDAYGIRQILLLFETKRLLQLERE